MQLTILHLQELAGIANKAMHGCDVIIAGGAPRDILGGVPVKDIDIFVHAGEDLDWEKGCETLAAELHGELELSVCKVDGYGCFVLAEIPSGYRMCPVQLVRVDRHPVAHLGTFDFGICQVYVNAAQIRMTKAYWHDVHNKQITFLLKDFDEKQRLRSLEHLERLQAKYPKYRVARGRL